MGSEGICQAHGHARLDERTGKTTHVAEHARPLRRRHGAIPDARGLLWELRGPRRERGFSVFDIKARRGRRESEGGGHAPARRQH